ncbi:MAG TPA: TspO/MBR family protein [Gemmatimonadales bacterium]
MTDRSPRALKVLNVAMFAAVMVANAAAGAGALSGESIGTVANRYPNYFLPANWVFGIWSLIYLFLAVFTVYQAVTGAGPDRAVRALGPWWTASVLLNIGWVTAFAYSRFGLAMVIMLVLLATLVRITERLHDARLPRSLTETLCVRLPFDLYLSWISVAVIANTFQYAHVVGWGGFGLSETTWSVAMMAVATVLGWVMVLHRGVWAFPPTVAWAIYGIGARFPEVPAIALAAGLLVPAGIAGGVLAWLYRRRASRRAGA